MKRVAALLACAASLHCYAAPSAIPPDWAAFNASTAQEDRGLVASVGKLQWWQACSEWGRVTRAGRAPRRQAALAARLVHEQLVNGEDLNHVKERTPSVGMTLCGVYAVMGEPDTRHTTQTARGYSTQLVYRGRHMYVYTDGADINGTVRAIQF
jgi:hypothetical protein